MSKTESELSTCFKSVVTQSETVVSVHYPGMVKDVSKMLETLGGIRTISSVYSEKYRRLELHFRPEDAFCKPTYGSRRPVLGLLLKIKVIKNKKTQERKVVSCNSIGFVTEEYQFTNLCDFQYLASTKEKCIYDDVVPKGLDYEWLKADAPLFLPPVAFSRVDAVQSFNFSKCPTAVNKPNIIGMYKRKRYSCTKFLCFENPEVPTLPKQIPSGGSPLAKIVTAETLELFNSLFQKRPIYSKSAMRGVTRIPAVQLKCILPCVAYFFTNGPWRSLWVRFGYDPRTDPSSRIYQTLDYRVRKNFSQDDVKSKSTSSGSYIHRFSNSLGKNTSVISRNTTDSSEKEEKSEEDPEYIFRPGVIPPSRQCYYQYCDIHIPEIQELLLNLDPVDKNAVCHETHGWMPTTLADTCRDIMNRYITEEVNRRNRLSDPSTSNEIMERQDSNSSSSDSDLTDWE